MLRGEFWENKIYFEARWPNEAFLSMFCLVPIYRYSTLSVLFCILSLSIFSAVGLEVLNIVLLHKSYLYFGMSIGFIVLCSNVLSIVIIVMCIHRHAVLCMLMRVTYIYVYCDVYFGCTVMCILAVAALLSIVYFECRRPKIT